MAIDLHTQKSLHPEEAAEALPTTTCLVRGIDRLEAIEVFVCEPNTTIDNRKNLDRARFAMFAVSNRVSV